MYSSGASAARGPAAASSPNAGGSSESLTYGEITFSPSRRRVAREVSELVVDAMLPPRLGDGLPEGLPGGLEGHRDALVVMGERGEPCLELGGRRVDALVQHRAAEASVGRRIAGGRAGEIADRFRAE